jgi:hypothetical protein
MAVVLTDEDIAAIKSWVGSEWSTSDIEDRFDRLGNFDEVVLEILNQQIADLSAQPSSFSVPGLSVSQGQNMITLSETIKRFRGAGGLAGGGTRFIKAFRPDYNRRAR